MTDIVQFVIKMKDLASGSVIKMASTAKSSFAQIDNSIAATQRKIAATRPSIDGLNRKLDELRKTRDLSIDTRQVRNANREIQRLENRIQNSQNIGRRNNGGGGLMGLVGGARGMAAAAGITAIVAGVGTSIASGMQGGANKVAFETMAGVKEGAKLYGDLNKFAQDSIFGTEVLDNAKTMLAFGASAKEVMPDIKMLGDISMGNKERLQSLTLAYSQIRSSGRLMGQDLLQLVNAGFNPLQIISEKTGRSMAQLKKDMEDGKIPFEMVKKAFESATTQGGRFFDMTNKIADTPFGKWEAFKGQLQGVALQFGTQLLPFVSKLLDVMPSLLTQTAEFASMLIHRLSPVLSQVVRIISVVAPPALKIVGGLLEFVMNLIGPILTGIGHVIDGVDWVVSKVFGFSKDKKLTSSYAKAGEVHGVAYATEFKSVIDSKIPAPTITDALKKPSVVQVAEDAGRNAGSVFTQGLGKEIDQFNYNIDVPVTFSYPNGIPKFDYDGGISVGESANRAAVASGNAFNSKFYSKWFNENFNKANGAPLPQVPQAMLYVDNKGVLTQVKQVEDVKWGVGAWDAANATKKQDPAKKVEAGWNFSNGAAPSVGAATRGSNITGSGVRSIVFNIDTLGVKGGMTINTASATEGAATLKDIVVEQLNRALDSVGGAVAY